VLAGRGIDPGDLRSKHLDALAGDRFDHVITLCDRVREVCPELPGHPRPTHWSIADPAAGREGQPGFERVAGELDERIRFFLHTLAPAA
jgi:protein-tyrosine-phosphatase